MGRGFGLIEDHAQHTIAEIGYRPQGVLQFGIVRIGFGGFRLGHGLGNPFGVDFPLPHDVFGVLAQGVIHAGSLARKCFTGTTPRLAAISPVRQRRLSDRVPVKFLLPVPMDKCDALDVSTQSWLW
jgi:hypothetical protein